MKEKKKTAKKKKKKRGKKKEKERKKNKKKPFLFFFSPKHSLSHQEAVGSYQGYHSRAPLFASKWSNQNRQRMVKENGVIKAGNTSR